MRRGLLTTADGNESEMAAAHQDDRPLCHVFLDGDDEAEEGGGRLVHRRATAVRCPPRAAIDTSYNNTIIII